MKLNTVISDGNRILFQVYPVSTFLNTSILLCYSSQCPVHFSKEVFDWCKWLVNTLQALLRNFLLLNNFATWSLVLQRLLLRCVFFLLEPGSISLHSYPSQRIWVKWYWTQLQKIQQQRSKNLCNTRDRLQNYLLLFLFWGGGGVPKSRCYDSILSYRSFSRRWRPLSI
jgi:hypothetical protein